jgi:ArsR family transcriptional regulator, arsenate/arsenite/antimonite-responsive transcriptional repressor
VNRKRQIDLERYSEIFKALGHPVRLRIVLGLCSDECNVTKMVRKLKLPQSTVSQHLGILRSRGILVPRRDGVQICYTVADDLVREIVKTLQD